MPDKSGQDVDVIRNRSAAGGVNTFAFAMDLADDQAVELTNIDASVPGQRKSRGGTTLTASGITFGPVVALGEFQAVSASTELLAITPGATYPNAQHMKLWSWDGTGTTWSLKGTLTGFTSATAHYEIMTGFDFVSVASKPHLARIFTDQNASLAFVYDGTSLGSTNAAAAVPVAGMFPTANMQNRGFAAGTQGANRGKVYFARVATMGFTGWATTQAFTFGGGTRQTIVAIKPFRNEDLVVFMGDRIEALVVSDGNLRADNGSDSATTPYTEWSRLVIDTTIGCASHRCVASTGEDLIFVDQYGNVRSLNRTITDNSQGIKSLPISAAIQTYIDRINPAAFDRIAAAFYDRFYVVGLPLDTATTPNNTFIHDVINKAWYGPWTGLFPAQSMVVATMTNTAAASKYLNPSLYLGAGTTTGGMVFRAFDGNTDAGASIVFQETTKRYYADELEAPKFFRRIKDYYVATGGETMMVEAQRNAQAWTTLGYIDLTGDTLRLPFTFPFSFGGAGIARKTFTLEQFEEQVQDMQFRFTVTCTNEVNHLGFSLLYHHKNIDWTVD